YDPVNAANPTTPAYPVTASGGVVSLPRAFHRWSPPESGGNSSTYTAVTYDFSSYNAATAATPAPDTFGSMTDNGTITYVGDRWRRADGSISKTDTGWAAGNAATRPAATALELLGYNAATGTAPVNIRTGAS